MADIRIPISKESGVLIQDKGIFLRQPPNSETAMALSIETSFVIGHCPMNMSIGKINFDNERVCNALIGDSVNSPCYGFNIFSA